MGEKQGTERLSRRDLFKVGTTIAGAALLQPSIVRVAAERIGQGASGQDAGAAKYADATKASVPFPTSLRPARLQQPNVVLIVLDTVRSDHLSCYGYHRETTPNIDAFAAGARVYKNVLSPGGWTLPVHASLFTGLSVRAHGAHWAHQYIDKRFPTLAEQLASGGYQTIGLVSNSYFVSPSIGIDQGFQTFWVADYGGGDPLGPNDQWSDRTTRATDMHNQLARWLTDEYDAQKPFFLFMNYIEAHQAYLPPPESLRFTALDAWNRWKLKDQIALSFGHMLTGADILSSTEIAELESLYDDAICYVDRKVGEVLSFLKETGLDENTVVVITADHGEHFGEHHLMSHQFSLYEPLVRAPLIVRYADRLQAGEEKALCQNHDIYPTILELAGLEWQRVPGQTCRSLLQPASAPRYGISEYTVPDLSVLTRASMGCRNVDYLRFVRPMRVIQQGTMKLVCRWEDEYELYDLATDPLETRNLSGENPELTRKLDATLRTWLQTCDRYVAEPVPPRLPLQPISPKELEAMRGLGYIQ